MAEKQKIVTIIENNHITGVVYGTAEVIIDEVPADPTQQNATRQYQRIQEQKSALQKKRAENTKHK